MQMRAGRGPVNDVAPEVDVIVLVEQWTPLDVRDLSALLTFTPEARATLLVTPGAAPEGLEACHERARVVRVDEGSRARVIELGLDHARCEWVTFHLPGELYRLDKVSAQLRRAKRKRTDVVFTARRTVSLDGGESIEWFDERASAPPRTSRAWSSALIRRELIRPGDVWGSLAERLVSTQTAYSCIEEPMVTSLTPDTPTADAR